MCFFLAREIGYVNRQRYAKCFYFGWEVEGIIIYMIPEKKKGAVSFLVTGRQEICWADNVHSYNISLKYLGSYIINELGISLKLR